MELGAIWLCSVEAFRAAGFFLSGVLGFGFGFFVFVPSTRCTVITGLRHRLLAKITPFCSQSLQS